MPYYSPRDSYNRYAFLRWWCQNQWWVQIVVPCVVCAGVIGALLYQWNNERQKQAQDKLFEAEYTYMKEHPPELDPDLDEKAAAWRVIRMKKNDPSMPIPYKKKQLIVKHWKSIIVDMRPEEIQRLHDLLQDQPVKPMDDVEIDATKFEAPWQGVVSLDNMDPVLDPTVPLAEDAPDSAAKDNNEANSPDNPALTDNSNPPEDASAPVNSPDNPSAAPSESETEQPEDDSKNDDQPETESDNDNAPANPPEEDPEGAFKPETSAEDAPLEDVPVEQSPANPDESKNPEEPGSSVSVLPSGVPSEIPDPILLDSPIEQIPDASVAQDAPSPAPVTPSDQQTLADNAPLPSLDVDVPEPNPQAGVKERRRPGRGTEKRTVSLFEDVGPLEDNFLQQREDFIKRALEERNRKIEEFRKSQDPYQFIPSPWKRNPLVI